MKTMTKRIASVALAVMMAVTVLVSALPAKAFAVGEGAMLTVESSNAAFLGKTVKAWKMFDAKANADGSAATYTLVDGWKPFFVSLGLTDDDTLSQRAFEHVKSLDDSAKQNDFALKAFKWATGKPAPVTVTSSSGAATGPGVDGKYQASFTGLDFGYYVMSPDTNVERDTMLVNVTKTDEDTINLKSVFPTVDKTVDNKNHASAQVGDELTFTLTSTLPNAKDYRTYTFKFKDKMSNGLTYVDDSVSVWIEGEQSQVDAQRYTVSKDTPEKGNLVIELSDYKTNYQNYAGKKITVTYRALINENAAVINQDNPNSATVEYTTDPTTGGTGESEESKVHTYTFGFDIDKVDGANARTKLEGAVFELRTEGGDRISLVKVNEGVFRPAKPGDMAVVDDQVKTNALGKLQFVGLVEGTYQLVETVAPDGYNKLADPIKVIISATYNPDGMLNKWKADVESGTAQDGTHQIQVKNNKGILLPETGGMGTVIFTVAGIAIIAGGIAWKRSRRAGSNA